MKRSRVVRLLMTAVTLAALAIGASGVRSAIASSGWGYTGEGANGWADLSDAYTTCRTGLEQSPVDLKGAIDADLPAVKVDYKPIPLTILNNSHTIQVNAAPGNTIELDGEKYELLQMHFHHPGEHTIAGESFPMEAHFVHSNEKEELAVLGVFLKEGAENAALSSVWAAMPKEKAAATTIPNVQVDIASLLPSNPAMFQYFGSLTTPPCTQVVKWVVFKEPIEVSTAQIDQFKAIFALNARPTQPLHRRFLLDTL